MGRTGRLPAQSRAGEVKEGSQEGKWEGKQGELRSRKDRTLRPCGERDREGEKTGRNRCPSLGLGVWSMEHHSLPGRAGGSGLAQRKE